MSTEDDGGEEFGTLAGDCCCCGAPDGKVIWYCRPLDGGDVEVRAADDPLCDRCFRQARADVDMLNAENTELIAQGVHPKLVARIIRRREDEVMAASRACAQFVRLLGGY